MKILHHHQTKVIIKLTIDKEFKDYQIDGRFSQLNSLTLKATDWYVPLPNNLSPFLSIKIDLSFPSISQKITSESLNPLKTKQNKKNRHK